MADQDPFAQYAATSTADPFAAYVISRPPSTRSTVSNEEPGTFTGGFVKSLKEQASEAFSGAKPMLESAASPQTAGDFAGLLLPATALGTGLRSLRGYVGAAKNLVTGAAEGAADREGLKKIPAVMRGMLRTATDTASGRDRAFQGAPLAQQMESLGPTRPNPLTTRSGGPIGQEVGTPTPFHELPLSRQVESLPQRGPMLTGRQGAPPLSTVNPNDASLASQMESLPSHGPMPMGRQGTPPLRTETPFHERPLYQQMESLADAPSVVGSQRVGMSPRDVELPSPSVTSGLSAATRAELMRKHYSPEMIAKIEAQLKAKLAGQSQ